MGHGYIQRMRAVLISGNIIYGFQPVSAKKVCRIRELKIKICICCCDMRDCDSGISGLEGRGATLLTEELQNENNQMYNAYL